MTEIPSIEIQSLEPSAVIELFELDATALGGEILYFHAGTNELSQNIVWDGQTYVRYPIKLSGFELSGDGAFPRPKLAVSNALSAISLVLQLYGDLIGAKVTRRRTLKKFIDAENFTSGVNPDADPTAEFDADIYFIDRKSQESRDFVEFELASSVDLAGIKLPRRQIIQNVCVWKYRGAECGYTGAPLYDINDEIINPALVPSTLGKAVLTTKSALVLATTALKEAEATLSSAMATKGNACDYQFVSTTYAVEPAIPPYPLTIGDLIKNFCVYVHEVPGGSSVARYNAATVSLGATYRRGRFVCSTRSEYKGKFVPASLFYIELWQIDSAACSSATSAATTALNARNAAKATYDAALTAYNNALAALPEDDAIYAIERCGKRLNSCKMRFGENNPLPFGSFPSASLIK